MRELNVRGYMFIAMSGLVCIRPMPYTWYLGQVLRTLFYGLFAREPSAYFSTTNVYP